MPQVRAIVTDDASAPYGCPPTSAVTPFGVQAFVVSLASVSSVSSRPAEKWASSAAGHRRWREPLLKTACGAACGAACGVLKTACGAAVTRRVSESVHSHVCSYSRTHLRRPSDKGHNKRMSTQYIEKMSIQALRQNSNKGSVEVTPLEVRCLLKHACASHTLGRHCTTTACALLACNVFC
jgi:hypothetical protein